MLRHRALCDREDPMLTSSCSLPYAFPRLPRIPPMRYDQHTKIYQYSSSALPVLVSPRSGTFRTAARGPGTRWTSGTDRVRDLPIAPEKEREEIAEYLSKELQENCRREGTGRGNHTADILRAVMDRDRRLTGYLRGQVDQPTAPAGFELSNGWRVSYTISPGTSSAARDISLTCFPAGREARHVNISKDIQRQTTARCAQSLFL
jgi:hypothetical protein